MYRQQGTESLVHEEQVHCDAKQDMVNEQTKIVPEDFPAVKSYSIQALARTTPKYIFLQGWMINFLFHELRTYF